MKEMFKQFSGTGFDTMGIVLMLWICALPFIGLVIAPLLGPRVGASVAVGLLVVMLLICWSLCIPTLLKLYRNKRKQSQC